MAANSAFSGEIAAAWTRAPLVFEDAFPDEILELGLRT